MSFICCKKELKKTTDKVLFYPSKEFFDVPKLVEINLDKADLNFKGITNLIDKIQYEDSIPLIILKDKNTIRKIIPFVYSGGLIKMKNVLQITKDSILIDDFYSISELEKILKRHYENNGRIPYYSDSPKKALVEISLDTNQNSIDLKQTLIKLTTTFDRINSQHKDSLNLIVFFDNVMYITPPPPPPLN